MIRRDQKRKISEQQLHELAVAESNAKLALDSIELKLLTNAALF